MKANLAKPAISLLLALCMLIVLIPPPPAAAEDLGGKCGGEVTWSLTSDGTLTISGKGDLTSGNRLGDSEKSWPWYKYRDSVKTIEVKDGITSIGKYAFYYCTNAAKVVLPGSLKTIKLKAFYRCSNLEEVTIPQGVTEIGEQAFCTCSSLKRVYLPASITKVERVAFDYTLVQDVYYGGTKAQWDKVSLYASDKWSKRAEMHYSASALPAAAAPAKPDASQATDWYLLMAIFKNTNASGTAGGKAYTAKQSLTDAEVQRLYTVIDVFKEAMAGTGLIVPHIDTVVIDSPITKLENSEFGLYPTSDNVFTLLKNKGVDLSKYDHVTTLGTLSRDVPHTFAGITHLVPFADNPGYSFVEGNDHGKPLSASGLNEYQNTASVILHELLHTMEYLSGDAFDLHAIEDSFNANADELEFKLDIALVQNQIKSAYGSGVPAGTWTLARNKVVKAESLSIPDGTLKITYNLYQNLTNLKSVSFPSTLREIEYQAFEGCKNLKTVYIPASVTEIQYRAFNNTGITDVYYGGTEAQWKKITFTRASDGKDYNDQLKNAEIHFSSKMP